MRVIDVDASAWNKVLDFYDAVLRCGGAPPWHGRNINALIDSMVWGGINEVEQPNVIRLHNTARLRPEIVDHIALAQHLLSKACQEAHDSGRDARVVIEFK